MPKQIKELKDFSGGLNTKNDSKDIKDNEFIEAKGVMFDKLGKIRTSRRSERANDGTNQIDEYDSIASENIENGYGLGFMRSDNVIDKVRLSITAGNADTWAGKFISIRDNADDGNWLAGGSNEFTVFKVIQFVDNGSDPDYIYCYTVNPGSGVTQYHTQTAQGYNIFLSTSRTGASPSDTTISFSSYTETLNSTNDWIGTGSAGDPQHWTIMDPTASAGTPNWSIVGSGASSYAKFLTGSNSYGERYNGIYQKESENAVTWEANAWYSLKLTFTHENYDISSGYITLWLLGRPHSFDSNDVNNLVIEAPIQSGSMTASDNSPGSNFLIQASDNLNDDVRIESISLKKQSSWYPSTDRSESTDQSEANLIVVNKTDNSIDRYSYSASEWLPVFDRSPFTYLNQSKLQNLSINSAGVGTLATKTGGKVLLYHIDGAMRFIDTNFNTSHEEDLYANYWLGFINRNYFRGVGTSLGYENQGQWVFTLMDIHPPYAGTLHTSERTVSETPTIEDGYLTMMARTADPSSSQTVWESGADPDGWFAGKSGSNQSAYKFNRGASFPKAFLDSASDSTSKEDMVGAYCASKDYVGNTNDESYLNVQYHSDYDYRGVTNSANPGLNMYLDSQKTIYFDMYISDDCFSKISDSQGIYVYIGSKMAHRNAWTSSALKTFKYFIPKGEISGGEWDNYKIDLDSWTDITGSPDREALTKMGWEIRLNSSGVDVGEVTSPVIEYGTDYNFASGDAEGSGSAASAVNHHQQINLGVDAAGAGFAVGDLIFANFGGNDTSANTNDEFCTITSISGNNIYVTRPYLHNNIWATDSCLSGGTQAYPGASEDFDVSMKIQKISAVPNPAIAISNISYGDKVEGEWNGEYKFFYSWVYDGTQESKLYEYSGSVTASRQTMFFNFWIKEGEGGGFGLASKLGLSGHRIDKARIYYSKVSEEGEVVDRRYYLLGELDLDLGFKFANDDKHYAWTNDPINSSLLCIDTNPTTTDVRENLTSQSPPIADVFESSAGYSNSTKSVMASFKDIAFNNGIAYVASPYQATNLSIDTSAQNKKLFPDRILKSLPNQYDLIPSDNYIDVIIDDGESIVKIETFNDRLLQFKQNTLYVINISGELEFLEDTFQHLGVQSRQAVVKSDIGILFANRNGIYLYSGEGEPVNLTGKINETDWASFAGDGSNLVCIYIASMDQLIVASTSASDAEADTYIVDLPSQTVSKTVDGIDISRQYGATNIVMDTVNGQPIWISDDNSNEYVYTIDNFDDGTSATDGHGSGNFDLKTKFHDFDRPGVRKKIHTVRISYKCNATTNVSVKFETNQGAAFTKQFSNGTNFTSDELANTSGAWATAELKPDTSSEVNNIYSFALRIYSDGIVPEDFEINDISIVYRYKSVK